MRVAITGDVPDSPELTALETECLRVALAGAGHAELGVQARAAAVASRTRSGVGFVTRLRVPPELPGAASDAVAVVQGHHPALDEPAEFLLQVKNGRLHTIEAYCCQGLWPDDEDAFRLQGRAPAGAAGARSR